MADRVLRIQSIIGKNISEIIQFELHNKHIGLVSVNEVEVTKDFSLAKVYVSFIGSKYPNQNLEELNKCKGFIRTSLSKKIDIMVRLLEPMMLLMLAGAVFYIILALLLPVFQMTDAA